MDELYRNRLQNVSSYKSGGNETEIIENIKQDTIPDITKIFIKFKEEGIINGHYVTYRVSKSLLKRFFFPDSLKGMKGNMDYKIMQRTSKLKTELSGSEGERVALEKIILTR